MATKKALIEAIISRYRHDINSEGATISKRRLWYILKPQFAAIPSYTVIEKDKNGKDKKVIYLEGMFHNGKPVKAVTNDDFNKLFNTLAEAGEIDDSFILDNSRTIAEGTRLPHIILAAEKKTVEATALNLAERLGISCYVSGGFSSIYAAKKLMDLVGRDAVVLVISDYDKAGFHIQKSIGEHFNNCTVHRALINPKQIPSDRLGEYFAESEELGKHYELDVLNIHELAAVFMENIPEHLAEEIRDAYESYLHELIQGNEIYNAIEANAELTELRKQVAELEERLEIEYEAAFLSSNPIHIDPFTLPDIYDNRVKYGVSAWK